MARKDVDVHIRAHDRLTRQFRSAGRASSGLGRSLAKLAGIAAGFVGFRMIARQTIDAIRESVMFEKQLAEISTMLDTNIGPTMARFKTEIMALAAEFGQSKEVLSKGLYDILSSGIAAGKGITVLRVAAKAAIGGVTDTSVAVDALTTVINAYGLRAEDATKVSDLMFNTVKEGKIVYEELAENIGKIAPAAKAAGVPIEELFGMISTMVRIEKPERAFTALRGALMTSAKEGRRFLDVVREMKGANLEQILGAGFQKRAASGVAILTQNWEELEEQIVKAKNSAGKADIAFQKMANTNYQKMARLNQSWKNLKVAIGDAAAESKYLNEWLAEATAILKEPMPEWLERWMFGSTKAEVASAAAKVRAEMAAEEKKAAKERAARPGFDYIGMIRKQHPGIYRKLFPEKVAGPMPIGRAAEEVAWTFKEIFKPFMQQPKIFGFSGQAVQKALGAEAPEKTTTKQTGIMTNMLRELQRINKNTEVKVEGRSF